MTKDANVEWNLGAIGCQSCEVIQPGFCAMLKEDRLIFAGPIPRLNDEKPTGNILLLNPVDYEELIAFVARNRH